MATKNELKKSLDEKGIQYSDDATNAELEALLGDEDSEKKDEAVEDEGVIDAVSSKTGENTAGVMSPHSGVGENVPGDLVMPGQVVDPRTGKVLDGGGSDLATPRPNLSEGAGRVSAAPGQGWAGNHTV